MRCVVTNKQRALLDRLRASRGGLYLRGAEVRACCALVAEGLATLIDNGELRVNQGRSDGERWWAEAVRVDESGGSR